MLIDSHCHLDATEFDGEHAAIVKTALDHGIEKIIIPAVNRKSFDDVIKLSETFPNCFYALGFHPMYIDDMKHDDLHTLQHYLNTYQPIAVGEIGLDFFVTKENKTLQEEIFVAQLKLAKDFDLPVIMHVRYAIDDVLKYLRRYSVKGGIAHAFNGSLQQAEAFIDLGFKLGFGGAMTYPRATHIQTLAKILPIESIVLETDAPDIPPSWLGHKAKNSPSELYRIATFFADLRCVGLTSVIEASYKNTLDALPKIV
ncbi:MAG: TatD family deoxyribonuclease [Candidatus Methylopumilus sp.]|nr:TatD family deoxyribonuclease [Candidatus Methylopumilus sp.]